MRAPLDAVTGESGTLRTSSPANGDLFVLPKKVVGGLGNRQSPAKHPSPNGMGRVTKVHPSFDWTVTKAETRKQPPDAFSLRFPRDSDRSTIGFFSILKKELSGGHDPAGRPNRESDRARIVPGKKCPRSHRGVGVPLSEGEGPHLFPLSASLLLRPPPAAPPRPAATRPRAPRTAPNAQILDHGRTHP